MKERVRNGHDIFMHFDGGFVNMPQDLNVVVTNQPRDAISAAILNATGVKWKQSGREYNSRNQKDHWNHVTL